MTAMRSLVSFDEYGEDLLEAIGIVARRRRSKISGSRMAEPLESSSGYPLEGEGGRRPRATRRRQEKRFFLRTPFVAVEVRRRGGAHGQKQRAGCGLAEGTGQLGAGEPGHAQVGEDAVEQIG